MTHYNNHRCNRSRDEEIEFAMAEKEYMNYIDYKRKVDGENIRKQTILYEQLLDRERKVCCKLIKCKCFPGCKNFDPCASEEKYYCDCYYRCYKQCRPCFLECEDSKRPCHGSFLKTFACGYQKDNSNNCNKCRYKCKCKCKSKCRCNCGN